MLRLCAIKTLNGFGIFYVHTENVNGLGGLSSYTPYNIKERNGIYDHIHNTPNKVMLDIFLFNNVINEMNGR